VPGIAAVLTAVIACLPALVAFMLAAAVAPPAKRAGHQGGYLSAVVSQGLTLLRIRAERP